MVPSSLLSLRCPLLTVAPRACSWPSEDIFLGNLFLENYPQRLCLPRHALLILHVFQMSFWFDTQEPSMGWCSSILQSVWSLTYILNNCSCLSLTNLLWNLKLPHTHTYQTRNFSHSSTLPSVSHPWKICIRAESNSHILDGIMPSNFLSWVN